jgi:hypothetical protein
LILGVIFGAVLLVVFVPYWLLVERPESTARQALRKRRHGSATFRP